MAGHYHAEQATIALAPLAAAAGVRLVDASAAGLDAARRQVLLADGRRIEYDLLSIGSGAAMDYASACRRARTLFVRPCERFLAQLEALLDAASMRALDVVVVGACGAAGVELALALQFRLALLGSEGFEAGRVALVIGGERVLPDHPAAAARHAEVALNRARVTLFRDRCVEVKRDALVLASGARVACDVPVLATGEAPAWLAGGGLALDRHGFVVTGPTLQSGSHPRCSPPATWRRASMRRMRATAVSRSRPGRR
ncbi:MAG: FAD-dependent oxidoreductase [Rubrivivax sp.]